jgi:hypothetical protein
MPEGFMQQGCKKIIYYCPDCNCLEIECECHLYPPNADFDCINFGQITCICDDYIESWESHHNTENNDELPF